MRNLLLTTLSFDKVFLYILEYTLVTDGNLRTIFDSNVSPGSRLSKIQIDRQFGVRWLVV